MTIGEFREQFDALVEAHNLSDDAVIVWIDVHELHTRLQLDFIQPETRTEAAQVDIEGVK